MADSHEKNPADSDGWMTCPPGTFEAIRTNHELRKHTWRPYATGVCLGIGLALAVVTASSFFPSSPTQTVPTTVLACEQVGPVLVAYAAGDLDPATREQVAAHLSVCEHCSARLAALAHQDDHSHEPAMSGRWQLAMK